MLHELLLNIASSWGCVAGLACSTDCLLMLMIHYLLLAGGENIKIISKIENEAGEFQESTRHLCDMGTQGHTGPMSTCGLHGTCIQITDVPDVSLRCRPHQL